MTARARLAAACALLGLLPGLAGCGGGMRDQAGERVVLACLHGDPASCRTRDLPEQVALDRAAILLGMRLAVWRG